MSTRGLQVEELPPTSPVSVSWLPRLTLGGAICGTLAGSFAGAVLGMVIGAIYHDISIGLDGAILGAVVSAAAGAAYGFFLALRERKNARSSGHEAPIP